MFGQAAQAANPAACLQLNLTASRSIYTIHAMYILTRYVIWEVLKIFLAALVGLTLICSLGMGFKEGLARGLPALLMMRTIPFMLPEMLGITIPVAMLYAVSSVFGRMTGTNEVVALKSLGIDPMVLVWPVLVLASFLSFGTVGIYEVAARWCRPSRERIVCESLEELIYGVLQKNTSLDDERLPVSITVKRVAGRKLLNPIIVLKGQPGRPQTTIIAEEAEICTDWSNPAAPVLFIICTHFTVDIEGAGSYFNPGTERFAVPISVPPPNLHHRDWVAMKDVPRSVSELEIEIKGLQKDLELRDLYSKANKIIGNLDAKANVERIKKQIADKERRIASLRTEPYRRWSNGFTCLCFALIGMPVAMIWRHADALTNFFVCFLPILAIYYPLLMLGEDLTTSGRLPPIFFWMGNVALVGPAIALLRWVNKH
jgi:lipopolysaccharide export system permease protein